MSSSVDRVNQTPWSVRQGGGDTSGLMHLFLKMMTFIRAEDLFMCFAVDADKSKSFPGL